MPAAAPIIRAQPAGSSRGITASTKVTPTLLLADLHAVVLSLEIPAHGRNLCTPVRVGRATRETGQVAASVSYRQFPDP
jgi:hypothetical protein